MGFYLKEMEETENLIENLIVKMGWNAINTRVYETVKG